MPRAPRAAHLHPPQEPVESCAPDSGPACDAKAPLSVRLAVSAAVLLPLLGLAGALVLLWGAPFYWHYLALFGLMYTLTSLGIGVGFHRLFTHRSFQAGRAMRFIWGVLGSMAIEGPLIKWVAVHRKHHQHADEPGDPHSPHLARTGRGGVLALARGLWHAHMGWLFEPDAPDLPGFVPDLRKDAVVRFVDRMFPAWVALSLLIPAALGGLLTLSWTGALLGFLWGGLVRVLLVHHVTWSVNSVCHLWGSRPFVTGDHSRDNPVFGVLAFGEGWHNTHHAFPASARHGLSWWKLDINYLVIRAMALIGLARGIRVPKDERLVERRRPRQPRRRRTPSHAPHP